MAYLTNILKGCRVERPRRVLTFDRNILGNAVRWAEQQDWFYYKFHQKEGDYIVIVTTEGNFTSLDKLLDTFA